MIVKTTNPVLYSNAFGDGSLKDKLKGFVDKQKGDGGVLSKAKSLVGGYLKGGQQDTVAQPIPNTPPPAPIKKGMSKKVKIGLIVGGSILVITIIAVVVLKSKNKGK